MFSWVCRVSFNYLRVYHNIGSMKINNEHPNVPPKLVPAPTLIFPTIADCSISKVGAACCHWWLPQIISKTEHSFIVPSTWPGLSLPPMDPLPRRRVLSMNPHWKSNKNTPPVLTNPVQLFASQYDALKCSFISLTPPGQVSNVNDWTMILERERPTHPLMHSSRWPHRPLQGSIMPHGPHAHHLTLQSLPLL